MFEKIIVDNLRLAAIYDWILNNDSLYYKAKRQEDSMNDSGYYRLSAEEFDILVDNRILEVTTSLPSFVIASLMPLGRDKIMETVKEMRDYIVNSKWEWEMLSNTDDSVAFSIENIVFRVKVDENIVFRVKMDDDNLQFVTPLEGMSLRLAAGKLLTSSDKFVLLINLVYKTYPQDIEMKIAAEVSDTDLADELLDQMLQNKMSGWRRFIREDLTNKIKDNKINPTAPKGN
jgi:hypothetical protein